MRFDGRLDKWNDDRGFGFVVPLRGGEPVFVHVSAFPRDGRRPTLGEGLTFEVEAGADGRKRAINVQRAGHGPMSSDRGKSHRPRKEPRSSGVSLRTIGLALAMIAAGGYAYTRFAGPGLTTEAMRTGIRSESHSAVPAEPPFRCDGRTRCSQMTSCAEATFFLRNCPGTSMDGDRDGVPCEAQWCPGG